MLVRNKTSCFCISLCISLNNVQERTQSHLGSIAVELGSKGFCLFELFEAILRNICCTLTKSHMFFWLRRMKISGALSGMSMSWSVPPGRWSHGWTTALGYGAIEIQISVWLMWPPIIDTGSFQ